jgi:nicotinate dehydrogenase subunit B
LPARCCATPSANGHDRPGRIPDLAGDRDAALGRGQRGAMVAGPRQKDVQSRQQMQLAPAISQVPGDAEGPADRGLHLVAVAALVHGGDGERFLKRQFALRAEIALRQRPQGMVAPAFALAQQRQSEEQRRRPRGELDAALQGAARRLRATYDFAIHTHGSIGPSCAVAQFVDGALTCWTASQSTHSLRGQLATMLGLPVEAVRCIYVDGAGCYGRNGHEDAAADAALLSRAMGGAAVRVQWMRADEHVWDPKGPPTLLDMEAGIDGDGTLVAWRSMLFAPATVGSIVPLLPAELAGTASTGGTVPGTVIGNLAVPYAVPAVHTQAHRLETTPFRPAWIRSPGRMQNTFANEGFLDECAAVAGADPLAVRLKLLSDPRAVEVLQRLARLSGWQPRPSPQNQSGDVLRGRGLAYVHYDLTRAHVGVVAEVEMTRSTGAIRVARLFVAQDCGQISLPLVRQ